MTDRFRLVSDDDDHWYVIPATRAEEWYDWVASEEAMDGELPPKWALSVNGSPSARVTFTDPRIE